MVRTTIEKRDVGNRKLDSRRGGWGRSLVRGILQGAVIFAVGASVPEGWGAGSAAPPVAAGGKVSLHVTNVPVGTAAFSNSGAVTTVRTGTNRTIINYSYLNVGAGGTLNFIQPSASGQVLNRISGVTPTRVDGTITSNGAVWLVNPGGVFFGKGAVVNTGQFVAAASHITDSAFLSGSKNFTGATGSVVNQGTITAQEVHLTGLNVANFGTIATGTGGIVTMTSGKDVYIGTTSSPAETPRVMVKVTGGAGALNAQGTGVVNAGSVRAPGGQIRVGAGDLFAAGIYTSGTLQAQQVTVDSGKGTNIVAGNIDASSTTAQGGTVEVLGTKVAVEGTIDASGATGGGTVLIGGALHGGSGVPISQVAVVTADAEIHADATGAGGSGDGGTVVVYSSQWSRVDGLLSALTVPGGAGGMIETSSEGTLTVTRMPEAGKGGTWLMDPEDVTIGGSSGNSTESGGNPDVFAPQGNKTNVNVKATDIQAALANGTSVTVNTTSPNGASGNITWVTGNNISLSGAAGATLTLNANGTTGNIDIESSITETGATPLHITLNAASGSITVGENITTDGGTFRANGASFTLASGKSINTTSASAVGGQIVLQVTGNVVANGSMLTGNGSVWSAGVDFVNNGAIGGSGGINLLHTGNVTFNADVNAGSGVVEITGKSVNQTGGNVTASGTGGVAAVTTGGSPTDAIKLTSANNAIGNIGATVNSGGNVTIVTQGPVRLDTLAAPSSPPAGFSFTSQSGITASGSAISVTSAGGSLTVSNNINAGTGNVTLTTTTSGDIDGDGGGGHRITAGNISLVSAADVGGTGGLDVIIDSTGSPAVRVTPGGATNSARLAFTNGGGGAVKTSQVTVTNGAIQDLSIQTNGSLTIDSAVNKATGNVTLAATGASILSNGGSVTAGNISFSSVGGSIGNTTAPISFTATGTTTFTLSANSQNVDFNAPATLNTAVTFSLASSDTVGVFGPGGLTIGTNLAVGANNTLIVTDATSVTLNAGSTLSGGTVYVTSAGDVAVKGNVTANTTALLQGNSVTDGGTGIINAPTLGVNATGNAAGVSISLTQANVVTTLGTGSSGTGTVAFTSNQTLAVGNVSAFSPAGFTAFGSVSGVNGNTSNVTLTAASITNGGGTVTGSNIALTATTGGIGATGAGNAVLFSTAGNVTLLTAGAGSAGNIFVQTSGAFNTSQLVPGNGTLFTDNGSVQLISVTSTSTMTVDTALNSAGDDVALTGTTVTVTGALTGANVTLTSTAGGISGAGGVTATVLNLTSNATINLTGNAVGTVNAGANGTVTFGNAGGFTAGNITSNGNTISLQDTTGAITIGGGVNAGAGNASVEASTNIVGGSGTVTGLVVTLTADTGDIGTSGTNVSTNSGNVTSGHLVLSGGNIFVHETHAIDTTNVSVTTTSGDTLSLTAPTITVTTAFGTNASSPLILKTTSGSITTGAGGSLVGSDMTLNSAAGINVANVTVGGNLSLTANAADISVTLASGTLDLGKVTMSDTAGQTVSLIAPAFTMTGNLTAAGDTLLLKATTAGGTTTITSNISAQSITLIADDLAISGGALLANATSGTLQIEPLTLTRGINLSGTVVGGVMNVDPALLTGSTASAVVLGGSGVSGNMTVGAANLSGGVYGVTLQTTGTVTFTGTLTLANNETLTLDGANGILNSAAGNAIVIGGGSGTVVFSNLKNGVGNGTANLTTQVSFLDGMTGDGTVHLSNQGNLTINGVVSLANGTGGSLIEAHSPLDITANVTVAGDLTLTATGGTLVVENHAVVTANGGNLTLNAGTDLNLGNGTTGANSEQVVSTGGNVTLIAGGNIALDANSTVSAVGNIANMSAGGFITMNGTTPVVTAGTLIATAVTGIKLDSNGITVGAFFANNTTSGNVTFTDQSGVAITGLNEGGTGNVTIVALGNVTQSGATAPITLGGGILTVQTWNNSGASITLNNAGNNLGAANATLQVRDATGAANASVAADVTFRTLGQMHLQQVDSGAGGGANVTLTGTTIDQVVGDAVGIRGTKLTVNSAGDVTLKDTNNVFTTLAVTDTNGAASALQFITNASGGLTISGFSQTNQTGTASVTNQIGAITSTAALSTGDLSLTAGNGTVGGISLSNTSNSIPSMTLINNGSGAILVATGSDTNVKGSTQNAGNSTTFTVGGNMTVSGGVTAGTALSIDVGAGNTFITTGADIGATGPIAIRADNWNIDPLRTITGTNVTLSSESLAQAITFDGATAASGSGLSDGELASVHATNLIIGASNQTGGITSGSAVSFGGNVSGTITLLTAGNITLAGSGFTVLGAAPVSMQHTGTLTLANATFTSGFAESAIGGSGAGGVVTLSGAIHTTDSAVTFNSQVQLGADAGITTVNPNGADITFAFSGGPSVVGTAGTENLTLTAGTGNITFGGPIGTPGTPIGLLTVTSANAVTLPTAQMSGANITHTGLLTVSGNQTVGTGGFSELGGGNVSLGASISGSTGNIHFVDVVALTTGTVTIATTGGNITFDGTVDSDNVSARNLTLTTTTGNMTFSAAAVVGGVHALGNLTTNGSGILQLTMNAPGTGTLGGVNAGNVTVNTAVQFGVAGATATNPDVATTGSQSYNGNATLLADTFLVSSGSGSISFATLDGPHALVVNTAGQTWFQGLVGSSAPLTSITTDAAGSTKFGNGSAMAVSTTGNQTYNDAVTLGNDATLTSGTGNLTFGSTVDSDTSTARSLTLTATSGNDIFNGDVGTVHALANLTTNGSAQLQLNMTAPGSGSLAGVNAGNVTVNNTAVFNVTGANAANPSVATTGSQVYTLTSTLSKDTVVASSGGGNITFAGAVDGAHALTVNTAGLTWFKTDVGAGTALTNLTTDGAGSTELGNGATIAVKTSGAQSFGDALIVNATTTLTSTGNGAVTFGATINGANALTVNTGGLTWFQGSVGGSTALVTLTTDAAGTVEFGNGSALTLKTSGDQTYNDAATLGGDAALVTTGSGNISFNKSVDSTGAARALTLTTAGGNIVFGANALVGDGSALSSLVTNGTGQVVFNETGASNATPTVKTTGVQIYNTGVTLNASTFLQGPTVTLAGTVMGNGNDLTILGDGVFTVMNNLGALNASGNGTFNGAVTATSINIGGLTTINTPSTISSTNAMTFNSLALGANTSLAASTVTVTGSTTGNGKNLTVTGNGTFSTISGVGTLEVTNTATYNGTVSAATLLDDGATTINTASITTTGLQQYSGATTLGMDTTLTTGTQATFGAVITGNSHAMTVNGNGVFAGISGLGALHVTNAATFNGTVGAASVLVDGVSTINTASITTTGTQQYSAASSLGATTTLTGTTVTFVSTLTGNGHDLTVTGNGVFAAITGVGALQDTGGATFGGNVSAGSVAVTGASAINTANITTTGTQSYNGAATLGMSTSLTGTTVTFSNLLTGNGHDLAVHGNGTFNMVDNVGDLHVTGLGTFNGNMTLVSLQDDGSSVINAASITTTGAQTYTGASSLGANATPAVLTTGSTVTFGGLLTGNGESLTVTGNGEFAQVSGIGSLIVTKAATFNGTVNGTSLSVGGLATVNAANITTTGTQTYTGGATLGQTATLAGSAVTFESTLTGAGHDLTVGGAGSYQQIVTIHNLTDNGSATFNKAVTGTGLLHVTGAATINGTITMQSLTVGGTATVSQNITTTGDQTYSGALSVNLTTHDLTLRTNGTIPSGQHGAISVGHGVTSTGAGTLTFETAATSDGKIVNDSDHAIQITGNVSMGAASISFIHGGAVEFAPASGTSEVVTAAGISFQMPAGKTAPDQTVATIFDKSGDLTFTTGAGGFFMAHAETMSVYNTPSGGNLTITSPGNITLGDIGALGSILVDAQGRPISFQAHGNISLPMNVNSVNQFTQTLGVVAGVSVTMNGTLQIPQDNISVPPPVNFKNEVWFSVPSPGALHLSGSQVTQGGANGTQASGQFFSFSQVNAITALQFQPAGVALYLPADGSAPAFALQSSIPRDVQTLQPERAATVAGTMLEDLQHLGVNARPATRDELLAYLLGNAIYNDIPMTLTPAYKDMRVAANRLPNSPILPTVSIYRALFFEPVVDANGAAVMNADGTPQMKRRSEKIQASFEVAWDAYTTDDPKGAPEGLRAYLETKKSEPKMAQSLNYLNQLRELLEQIRSLGLTSAEFNLSKGVIFRELQPQNISSSDAFMSAIMGTTQTAKQNVPVTPKAEGPAENALKNVTAMK